MSSEVVAENVEEGEISDEGEIVDDDEDNAKEMPTATRGADENGPDDAAGDDTTMAGPNEEEGAAADVVTDGAEIAPEEEERKHRKRKHRKHHKEKKSEKHSKRKRRKGHGFEYHDYDQMPPPTTADGYPGYEYPMPPPPETGEPGDPYDYPYAYDPYETAYAYPPPEGYGAPPLIPQGYEMYYGMQPQQKGSGSSSESEESAEGNSRQPPASLTSMTNNEEVDASVAAAEKKGMFNPGAPKSRMMMSEKKRRKERQHFRSLREKAEKAVEIQRQTPPQKPGPCKYFRMGKCQKGNDCPFTHEKKKELCYYYNMKGSCRDGENCPYMHGEFPCRFYHLSSCSRDAETCRFKHGPLDNETQALLDNMPSSMRIQGQRGGGGDLGTSSSNKPKKGSLLEKRETLEKAERKRQKLMKKLQLMDLSLILPVVEQDGKTLVSSSPQHHTTATSRSPPPKISSPPRALLNKMLQHEKRIPSLFDIKVEPPKPVATATASNSNRPPLLAQPPGTGTGLMGSPGTGTGLLGSAPISMQSTGMRPNFYVDTLAASNRVPFSPASSGQGLLGAAPGIGGGLLNLPNLNVPPPAVNPNPVLAGTMNRPLLATPTLPVTSVQTSDAMGVGTTLTALVSNSSEILPSPTSLVSTGPASHDSFLSLLGASHVESKLSDLIAASEPKPAISKPTAADEMLAQLLRENSSAAQQQQLDEQQKLVPQLEAAQGTATQHEKMDNNVSPARIQKIEFKVKNRRPPLIKKDPRVSKWDQREPLLKTPSTMPMQTPNNMEAVITQDGGEYVLLDSEQSDHPPITQPIVPPALRPSFTPASAMMPDAHYNPVPPPTYTTTLDEIPLPTDSLPAPASPQKEAEEVIINSLTPGSIPYRLFSISLDTKPPQWPERVSRTASVAKNDPRLRRLLMADKPADPRPTDPRLRKSEPVAATKPLLPSNPNAISKIKAPALVIQDEPNDDIELPKLLIDATNETSTSVDDAEDASRPELPSLDFPADADSDRPLPTASELARSVFKIEDTAQSNNNDSNTFKHRNDPRFRRRRVSKADEQPPKKPAIRDPRLLPVQ